MQSWEKLCVVCSLEPIPAILSLDPELLARKNKLYTYKYSRSGKGKTGQHLWIERREDPLEEVRLL